MQPPPLKRGLSSQKNHDLADRTAAGYTKRPNSDMLPRNIDPRTVLDVVTRDTSHSHSDSGTALIFPSHLMFVQVIEVYHSDLTREIIVLGVMEVVLLLMNAKKMKVAILSSYVSLIPSITSIIHTILSAWLSWNKESDSTDIDLMFVHV